VPWPMAAKSLPLPTVSPMAATLAVRGM